jgi:fatty-acyl-CoA synthase
MREHVTEPGLTKNRANYMPLSPVQFLERSASIFPEKIAIRDGLKSYSYREFEKRCRQHASALVDAGISYGDTVAILAPSVPAMLEAHYAVPAIGAVLDPLNYRLDATKIAHCLEHGQAKILIADREFSVLVAEVKRQLKREIRAIDICDPQFETNAPIGSLTYEDFLAKGNPGFKWHGAQDEWDSLCLLYASGTTGDPKSVLYHHRGAYLNSLSNSIGFGLSSDSVYLWTLPMFHCNGWTYTWAVTAVGGTHICLRRVEPAAIFAQIGEHRVTHLCGAPIVLNMLAHAPEASNIKFNDVVEVATGGTAPPSAVIEAMERMGFRVTHLYGLTESYGPAALCVWQDSWESMPITKRAQLMARQGVPMPTMGQIAVADPDTHEPVRADGRTIGEVMLRGNTIMKGYLENKSATESAFREGWYHTGDFAVRHQDNYEIKDRFKDIIISGGENISSLEVEECLYRHPEIMEAAIVAWPDRKWGEIPCAFVTLKPNSSDVTAESIIDWCRQHIAHFKVPRRIVFGPLPKTSTGKIQKFILRDEAKASAARGSD